MPATPGQRPHLSRLFIIMLATSMVAPAVLIFTKYKNLINFSPQKWWPIEGPSTTATSAHAARPQRSIIIGEDCNDIETKCKYFRPIQFVSNWEETHRKERKRTAPLHRCYKNMISLYHLSCRDELIMDDRCYSFETRLNLPIQFVYKKLYKTGGTAIDKVLRRQTMRKSMLLWTFRPLKPSASMTGAHSFIEQVAYNQSQGADYPVVAVVRDPIPRFISAVNQIFNMRGRLHNCKKNVKIQRGDTKQIMRCAVNALVNGHRDPHFESLVADMTCNAGGRHDVLFSLYSMEDVPEVLAALGSKNPTEKINNSGKKNITLSISDMDNEMIQTVCRWYAADTAMMKSLGFAVSHCT